MQVRPDKISYLRPSEDSVASPPLRLTVERWHLKPPSALAQSDQRAAHFSPSSHSEQCNECTLLTQCSTVLSYLLVPQHPTPPHGVLQIIVRLP